LANNYEFNVITDKEEPKHKNTSQYG